MFEFKRINYRSEAGMQDAIVITSFINPQGIEK